MKYSKSETYSKVHALPNIDFEDQTLTSFAGLVIVQKFFATIELKKKLHNCFTYIDHGKIINRTTLFMQLIVHLLLGFRELNDCHFYRDDPLVKRLLGLKRIPNAATLSRFLKDATAQSVGSLRRCLREVVLMRLRNQTTSRRIRRRIQQKEERGAKLLPVVLYHCSNHASARFSTPPWQCP